MFPSCTHREPSASCAASGVKTQQPVEKVGAELKVTTNRAPEASKTPTSGVFGARSGVEAGVEGVFQQCTMALAGPPRSHENESVA